ncbi:FAD-dependent 5-carboxymethylaminomethyl-2-thiouridine(34) oxidoreductase MnmC [Campylobacter canadensis]|uniref:FAD-dependent 5-carboxymethylaminomethyl-2-thiouridine(34) oxidoreductase MnmC n=1 Tax=Campylobacter canadensis TaxID=449520 RepID=UPI001553F74A|nr:FAD-dependent 5-carboxymethylaminomethyl-2-thiouridine(34) oxidoreductase MnmC [Campylobacter canadensis]
MNLAKTILKSGEFFSLDFDDFYYNIKDTLKERNEIYVNNAFDTDKSHINILEFGFGLGLNFLLSLKKAKECNKTFTYTAIENYYQDINTLKDVAKKFNLDLADEFIQNYPLAQKGSYLIQINNTRLNLIFADINEALNKIDFCFDVIFADGFSPNKNSQMFSTNTIKQAKKCLKQDGILLSYSSNSAFLKALEENDFLIKKFSIGLKRESTKAILKSKDDKNLTNYFAKNYLKVQNIAIIGSGICAANLAYELRDFNVSIFEKNSTIASAASSNKIGNLSALIQNPASLLGEFSFFAYLQSSAFYKSLGIKLNGILEHAFNDELKKRFLLQKDNKYIKHIFDFAYLKDGGSIRPQELCKMLINLSKAKIFLNTYICNAKEDNNQVILTDSNDNKYYFDAVIFASGYESMYYFKSLPLSFQRGQVSYVKDEKQCKIALSSKAYLSTAANGIRALGATYLRNEIKSANDEDDLINKNNLLEFFDRKINIIDNNVGYRSYSSDRFAIVGAYLDDSEYITKYKDLFWTKNKTQEKIQQSRIFVNIAHGSRAFSTSLCCARLISSYFKNTPSYMFSTYEHALHPARFIIRKLKKGLI